MMQTIVVKKLASYAALRLYAFLYYLAWSGLLASLFVCVINAYELYRLDRQNALLLRLLDGQDVMVNELTSATPEILLAKALNLYRKHDIQNALDNLSLLLNQGDVGFQVKARYNLGNLYLRQAIGKVESGHAEQAKTLVSLAKQAYRDSLSSDSRFWDAKYNLEAAARLLPDFDRINTEDDTEDQTKKSLWTTVPGFPRGLP